MSDETKNIISKSPLAKLKKRKKISPEVLGLGFKISHELKPGYNRLKQLLDELPPLHSRHMWDFFYYREFRNMFNLPKNYSAHGVEESRSFLLGILEGDFRDLNDVVESLRRMIELISIQLSKKFYRIKFRGRDSNKRQIQDMLEIERTLLLNLLRKK